jgi:SAM-dependent methyltransferase
LAVWYTIVIMPRESIYKTHPFPEDHILGLQGADSKPKVPSKPSYGVDSPLGLLASNITAPLYLYSSLKGKFSFWDGLLSEVSADELRDATLDVGCGRGMVLLKVAQKKKHLAGLDTGNPVESAYGIDLFISGDQSGNSPEATYVNAASLQVLDQVVLHTADFTALPFADNQMSLVTASLSIHNASPVDRQHGISEICRVCRPGGRVLILDLMGYVADYEQILKSAGWQDVHMAIGGMKVMFGLWPCQILKARKPIVS